MARAIWKGRLLLGKDQVPVKLFSAVQDRTVHFRLLHRSDSSPVEQLIVRKDNGKEVPKQDLRKALPIDREHAVILQPQELEHLEPPASREIDLCRFVPRALLNDQWFERPYFLGPDGEAGPYFALVQALERSDAIGIARWVMRKKRYLGALLPTDGYAQLITLRRADQVYSVAGFEAQQRNEPTASELKLAEQLVTSIRGDFTPERWPDEYRQRVCELIDAKAHGKQLAPLKPKRRAPRASLADNLKASIAAARERKVA